MNTYRNSLYNRQHIEDCLESH